MPRLVAAGLNGMTAFCIAVLAAVLVGACASAALRGPGAMSRSSYFFGSQLQADFVQAVGRGDLRRANALIDAGAAVDAVGKDGMTPVLWSLSKQSLEGLRFLLRSGADPNRVTTWTSESGRKETASAMHLAAIMEDRRFLAAIENRWGTSAVGTTKLFGSRGVVRGSEDEAAYSVFVHELKTRGLW